MPDPEDPDHRALNRLGKRLGAFEATRQAERPGSGFGAEAGEGYRLLGQLLGGVLGGVGFGWLVDHFARTGPWGLVGGLGIGVALSLYAAVRTASRISARAEARMGPVSPSADDDEEDET